MSGHSQVMEMLREGKGKVDKTIQPPKGFGVVDYIFYRFQQHWRDEWRRRMVSQAGCEAIASEWQYALRNFSERHVREAVGVAISNTLPPSISQFVDLVEQIVADSKPVPVNRALGKQYLQQIKSLVKTDGGVDGSSTGA